VFFVREGAQYGLWVVMGVIGLKGSKICSGLMTAATRASLRARCPSFGRVIQVAVTASLEAALVWM
jgi:hypothetical protein